MLREEGEGEGKGWGRKSGGGKKRCSFFVNLINKRMIIAQSFREFFFLSFLFVLFLFSCVCCQGTKSSYSSRFIHCFQKKSYFMHFILLCSDYHFSWKYAEGANPAPPKTKVRIKN